VLRTAIKRREASLHGASSYPRRYATGLISDDAGIALLHMTVVKPLNHQAPLVGQILHLKSSEKIGRINSE
jgi:hypothetical protein